jgi:ketosteroid isomerase-like protein
MADSARAHIRRINDAIRKGDSAAYMNAYPTDVVLVFDGALFNGSRDQYAAAVGRQTREGPTRDAEFSNERITVVGPRAVAASLDFVLTMDSAGKSITSKGAWSGVLGIRNGRTVILQQHLSHMPASRP